MRGIFSILTALTIMLLGLNAAVFLWKKRPKVDYVQRAEYLPSVEVVTVSYKNLDKSVSTRGILEATSSIAVMAEISGRISWSSEKLIVGGEFAVGEKMLEIKAENIAEAKAASEAKLEESLAFLEAEQLRAEQTEKDWRRLGSQGELGSIARREPQLRGAKAAVKAARMSLAELESRSKKAVISAPFACRVVDVYAKMGNFALAGKPIASVYKTGNLRVSAPVSVGDYTHLTSARKLKDIKALIRLDGEDDKRFWRGRVISRKAVADGASRTVNLIVELEEGLNSEAFALLPGMMVSVDLPIATLRKVAVLPRSALSGDGEILLVEGADYGVVGQGRIKRLRVDIVHEAGDLVYARGKLREGDKVCVNGFLDMDDGKNVICRERN